MQTITEQTNLYAEQVMGAAVYEKRTPITEEELWAYIGFSILMAINYRPSLFDYWRTDEVYYYAPAAGRITRTRFLEIARYLHFVDNTCLPTRSDPRYNRLQKVQPVITSVLDACMSAYQARVQE